MVTERIGVHVNLGRKKGRIEEREGERKGEEMNEEEIRVWLKTVTKSI